MNVSFVYQIRPDTEYERIEIEKILEDTLSTLTDHEQIIIKGRYFSRETLQVLSDKLHVSKERIRETQQKALRKLRMRLGLKTVKDFLYTYK
jgi:RNA polymerase nonessential primary-like sigma factor